MASPNITARRVRERKWDCIAERVFYVEEQAKQWLTTQAGDRKIVRSFRVGRRKDQAVAYAARVYAIDGK